MFGWFMFVLSEITKDKIKKDLSNYIVMSMINSSPSFFYWLLWHKCCKLLVYPGFIDVDMLPSNSDSWAIPGIKAAVFCFSSTGIGVTDAGNNRDMSSLFLHWFNLISIRFYNCSILKSFRLLLASRTFNPSSKIICLKKS